MLKIKTFTQFLDNTRYVTNWLWSKAYFYFVWKLCSNTKATRDADPDDDHAVAGVNNPATATFKITDTKLYVPVVNL